MRRQSEEEKTFQKSSLAKLLQKLFLQENSIPINNLLIKSILYQKVLNFAEAKAILASTKFIEEEARD
ncbi:hypothetical protein ACMA1I_21960 [Pontibacter sp. 13R65]|uniref:hypothetical protein n=1 Tax=Pontibacter sp. 13R65 TaxID=3127458 RepID=UPI00301D5FCB